MIRLWHISDRHQKLFSFSNEDINNLQLFSDFLDMEFEKKQNENVYIVDTGDITHNGYRDEFEEVRKAMEKWKGKYFPIQGNHDEGAVGIFYNDESKENADEFVNYFSKNVGVSFGDEPRVTYITTKTEKIMLIGLNSCIRTYHPFDFACGRIGTEQLENLNFILDGTLNLMKESEIIIVYLHHHPFIHNEPFMELQDAKELWKVLYGRVDVVLFGHRHVDGLWNNIKGIPLIHAAGRTPEEKSIFEITIKDSKITHKYKKWKLSKLGGLM